MATLRSQHTRSSTLGSSRFNLFSMQYSFTAFTSRLIFLLIFVQLSWQQKDPINDFCRRFGHQTTVIDRKLYIDGGLVNWNPLQQNPQNYTNTWLLYNDLDVTNGGMPQIHELNKNASIPDVSGGILWGDNVNKRFYLFGGDYNGVTPDVFNLFSYDAINNYWVSYGQPSSAVTRVSWGAGVAISERGEGYYYGGWMSNASVPGWTGGPIATSNMIKYDMDQNVWTNSSGPDNIPRAEGVMQYIPASDGGMLIYFGGVATPFGNSTMIGMPMSTILVYDIAGSRWYNQTATGDVPDMRRRFCAGATWAQDQSSYNIYLYGGAGVPPNGIGFDEVYILSIPSFTWIKWYPSDNSTGNPHGWSSCNVIDNAQMIIIGGTFPLSQDCDAQNVWGTHNLDLGKQNNDSAMWHVFQPNLTTYAVPTEIVAKIGGSSLGGATVTTPAAGWGNRDLPILMTRTASVTARAATRSIPTSTTTSSSTNAPTNTSTPSSGPSLSTGAIAGIAVGGAVALIVLLLGCCIFIRSHRRSRLGAAPMAPMEGTAPWTQSGMTPMSPSFVGYDQQQYQQQADAMPMSPRPGVTSPVELAGQPSFGSPHSSPPQPQYSPHHSVQETVVQPKWDDSSIQNTPRSVTESNWPIYTEVQRQYNPEQSPPSSRSPISDGWAELGGTTAGHHGHNRRSPAPQYTSVGHYPSGSPPPRRPLPTYR